MSNLEIKALKLLDGIVVIGLKGLLDSATLHELEKAGQQYLDTEIYRFVFDLSQLEGIGSAGAGFFIKLRGVCSENHGGLAMVQPNQSVQEVLKLVGLPNYAPILSDINEAIKHLARIK